MTIRDKLVCDFSLDQLISEWQPRASEAGCSYIRIFKPTFVNAPIDYQDIMIQIESEGHDYLWVLKISDLGTHS